MLMISINFSSVLWTASQRYAIFCPEMIILFKIILFYFLFHIKIAKASNVVVDQIVPDKEFKPFLEANSCFNLISEPNCEFEIKISSADKITPRCLENQGVKILRLNGDFDVFKITCSATYPIDFIYYGIQPNEAIFVEWWKEVEKESNHTNESNDQYVVEVKVYSVNALYQYYNNPNNNLYDDPNDGIPYQIKHDYPRTGNYTFPGIFDHSIGTSFYLVLEEENTKPEFLRNNRTVAKIVDNNLLIPCVSSHLGTIVNISSNLINDENITHNAIEGFYIEIVNGKNYYGDFICSLYLNNVEVDSLTITHQKKLKRLYGFEDTSFSDVDNYFTIDSEREDKKVNTVVNPTCIIETDNKTLEKQLIYVPAGNFGFMRLRQQFALPIYYNRSYTARKTMDWDSLISKMKIVSGTILRMATVYCGNGHYNKLTEFGCSVDVKNAKLFGYGKNWSEFDRTSSKISVHFELNLLTTNELFADTMISYSCKVNIPVVSRPVVWYTRRKNGSIIKEFIDYNLDRDFSNFSKVFAIDIDRIYCSASYWYSKDWRNISMPVSLSKGIPPSITSTNLKHSFVEGLGKGSITCTSVGSPPLEIYFIKDEIKLGTGASDSPDGKTLILAFDLIKSSAGSYKCVAMSQFGTDEKEFIVTIDKSKTDLASIITIPVVVFLLTFIGAYVYIKFFRTEKSGLTKQEIEEFIKGLKQDVGGSNYEYAHDFAQLCKYTGEYEISQRRFKIDFTSVLGSGAFGLVLKGCVDNEVVAVKTLKRNSEKQYLKALLSELKIMIYLGNHPNLIEIVGAYTKELSKGIVYVFVKYLPHGSLESYLRNNKNYFLDSTDYMSIVAEENISKYFGIKQLLIWAKQFANGMAYLSSKKVIHGDLATRNILVDFDLTIRITDFGLSRQLYEYSNYVKTQQEPLPWRWMAFESLKYLSFSTASDVWSFGITLWEIFSLGDIPYPGYTWNMEFVEELENGLTLTKPKHASKELFQIIVECWNIAPEDRPSFDMLKFQINEYLIKEYKTEVLNKPNLC